MKGDYCFLSYYNLSKIVVLMLEYYVIVSYDTFFLSMRFNTDRYLFYIYLHNFWIDNFFSHSHTSILKYLAKVKGKR